MSQKILILSDVFGYGHTKVAEALKEGIQFYEPQWQVEIIELSAWLKPILSRSIASLYLNMLKYTPSIWGKVYRKIQHHPLQTETEFILRHLFFKKMNLLIQSYQPDAIICTHPFPSAVISTLKKKKIVSAPLLTVVTDYSAHGSWISSDVDQYFLSSLSVKNNFLQMGVAPQRIQVSGIPIRKMFWYKENQELTKRKLNLNSLPSLLCMGGGLGIGISEDLIEHFETIINELQIIMVTGKNQKLYDSFLRSSLADHPNFHLIEYTSQIHVLMDAVDVILTKPGGVTSTEAMAKGVPMIFYSPIPGQEEDNCAYLVEHGFGIHGSTLETVSHLIKSFIHSPALFKAQFRTNPLQKIGHQSIEQILRYIPKSHDQVS